MLAPAPLRHKVAPLRRRRHALWPLVVLLGLAACRAPPPGDGSLATTPPAPDRGVVLLHGFSRNPAYHADHLRALAAAGAATMAPALPSLLGGEAARARAVAVTIEAAVALRARLDPSAPLALVGFSAGAAIATEAAARLTEAGTPPDGLVLLDPVAWPGTAEAAAALPPDLPVLAVTAPPGGCNADGQADVLIAALPGPATRRAIGGASHCDFEAPTDVLCRLACGDDDQRRRATITDALVQFVGRL